MASLRFGEAVSYRPGFGKIAYEESKKAVRTLKTDSKINLCSIRFHLTVSTGENLLLKPALLWF